MKTVRLLLYRDIVWSVVFVAVAFLSLFFFIDFVDELENVGRSGYGLGQAALRCVMELPGHFYELFPIAVLIGTIYAMARLAQSSEFTILRTAGLGPGRALRLLALPGLVFALLTFVVGDYLAPVTERQALALKAGARGLALGGGGAWMKERRPGPDGERAISVNVSAAGGAGEMLGVRIFEFDAEGRLRTRLEATSGQVLGNGHWRLREVQRTDWPTPEAAARGTALVQQTLPALVWPSTLDRSVVAAALLPVGVMSTVDLWRYANHLSDQDQAVQRYEIQFWKKALYPLACVVMVALALPFAYLHARAGGISYKVFGGIMLGISFVLLNNASGHLGMLRQWTPWLVAAAPSGLYLLVSMAAFAWLVRYR
ncbi:MAG: LPS export ABC transporter permease LptG [Burkholderiaceae bacterium]|nr:LPS export ABC transporter permease LptG [Burkholderiaceae bacterium]